MKQSVHRVMTRYDGWIFLGNSNVEASEDLCGEGLRSAINFHNNDTPTN
jgi:hypothetical protein